MGGVNARWVSPLHEDLGRKRQQNCPCAQGWPQLNDLRLLFHRADGFVVLDLADEKQAPFKRLGGVSLRLQAIFPPVLGKEPMCGKEVQQRF